MVWRNGARLGLVMLERRKVVPSIAVVVGIALMATFLTTNPAAADETIAESEDWAGSASGNTIQIVYTSDETLVVSNPGSAAPISSHCTSAPLGGGSICIGQPDSGRAIAQPLEVKGGGLYKDFPESALTWIQDEAATTLAALHGVQPELMYAFGKGEIRAYTVVRLLDILDKKLYQEPMTSQEEATFAALNNEFQVRALERARQDYAEWERWTYNPCTYPVPQPPTADLKAIPNKVAKAAKCSSAGFQTQMFEFLQNMPEVGTFERWSAYRNPSDLLLASDRPAYKETITGTNRGFVYLAGLGAAIAAAGLVALSMVAVSAVVATGLTGMLWLTVGLSAFAAFTVAATATVVGAVLVALVTAVIGYWLVFQEASVGIELRDRLSEIDDGDPLGVIQSQPAYAGLSYEDREEPSDADQVALHHSEEFHNQLLAMVLEWTTLTKDGTFTPDGNQMVNLPPLPSDNNFRVTSILDGGSEVLTEPVTKEWLAVRAPEGTKDGNGDDISGYQVHFSRGWLMVSPFKNGAYRDPVPQLSLEYVDADGNPAFMSIAQSVNDDDEAIRQFLLKEDGAEPTGGLSDTWTFRGPGQRVLTTELDITTPLTREISLLPTVSGLMVPGATLKLASNVSTPGANAGGTYSWTIEQYDNNGEVVDSWSYGQTANLVAFQQAFTEVGNYRATVRFRGTDEGTPFDVSGSVAFAIAPPVPELLNHNLEEPELVDSLTLDGRLFLDLRMMQDTPSDVFDVDVEWAYGGQGDRVIHHYTVQCVPVGDGTCETGALTQPSTAPVNPQWSSSPSYEIPQDQAFLPQIIVRVTNSHGATVERVFEMPGEHRPTFADSGSFVEVPVGAFSRVTVTEVIPSPLQPNQGVSIFPYVGEIQEQLPEGMQLELVEDAGQTYVQIFGTPYGDQMGVHTIEVPIEQLPLGSGIRGVPALVTLAVIPSTEPGYRAILRNTPTSFVDRAYRSDWPDWYVQVALQTDTPTNEPFTGTVMCKLTRFGQVIVNEPCEQDELFPFPGPMTMDDFGDYQVTVETESDTQPVAGPPFDLGFNLQPFRTKLTVDPPQRKRGDAIVRLAIRDFKFGNNPHIVPTPFSDHDYTVKCAIDGGDLKPCLDRGLKRIQRSSGQHTLFVRVKAFDGAVVTDKVSWRVPR